MDILIPSHAPDYLRQCKDQQAYQHHQTDKEALRFFQNSLHGPHFPELDIGNQPRLWSELTLLRRQVCCQYTDCFEEFGRPIA
jgi:hypothetical protein